MCQDLDFIIFDDITAATKGDVNAIFAVVEITADSCENISHPSLTIRMHPSAVPDTRNFIWSPRLDFPMVAGAGEMLYFTSGFLSLQYEFQSFLNLLVNGDQYQRTQIFDQNSEEIKSSQTLRQFASAVINNSSLTIDRNHAWDASPVPGSTVQVPYYMRAFPSRSYAEESFWRTFGFIIATAMVLYITLPSAIVAGLHRQEYCVGIKDVLNTIPGVCVTHNAMSWVIASNCAAIIMTC